MLSGKQPKTSPERTRLGNHSVRFQFPFSPPLSCPMRTTTGFKTVFCATRSSTRSAAHFDSLYPEPSTTRTSSIGSSGARTPVSHSGIKQSVSRGV